MTIKIDNKITGFEVVKPQKENKPTAEVVHMHETIERPEGEEGLDGTTYKIKTPLDEHALYVTINDIVLNEGTPHELRRPFEIFINSKNMDHFQWIVALTRVMSAVFRKGGDVTFLAEELQAVFDPRGGYFKRGGKFMPSIVAEIGAVVETHLRKIGLIVDDELSDEQRELIEEKRQALKEQAEAAGEFPASATLCKKCTTKAMVILDNCETCLNCGYSKCG